MSTIETLRKKLFEIARSLPANDLATGSTGNISARDPETGYIVIKSSSIPYDRMCEKDFAVVTLDGTIIDIQPGQKPSFETPTHLEIYRKFPEVNAVLHTHTRQAIVLAAGRDEIESHMTTTGRRLLKHPIPVIPFIENGTQEMADTVTSALVGHVGVVIRNHGPFMTGTSVEEVFQRTVALRDVCQLYYEMALLGHISVIS